MEWTRLENESEEHLLMRLVSQKDQIGTWDDIARIMNELTGNNYGESCYRKKSNAFQKMFNANLDTLTDYGSYSESINEQKRELERAKIQYRDERNAWNKQNYLEARISQDLNYLGEKLNEIGKSIFEVDSYSPISVNSDNDLIVCLSDLHIGQEFDSFIGKYNSDIAQERLNRYLNKVIKIGERHNSENIYIELLGDQISGFIRTTVQLGNRENVIDQIKLASQLITYFCVELSKYFNQVYIASVPGNHSRIMQKKEDALKDERLDDLVTWIVEQMTSHIININVLHNNYDSTISTITVRGKEYLGCHGDNDYLTNGSVGKLVMAIGKIPYAIISGHRHTPAYQEFNNVKFIQSGTLSCGDDYSVSQRLAGKPNQTVLVCNNKGIECIYNVELD